MNYSYFENNGFFKPDGKVNRSFESTFLKQASPEQLEWYERSAGSSLTEKVYLLREGLHTPPICPQCGKPVPFLSFSEGGYRAYCSNSCAATGRQQERIAKGKPHHMQTPEGLAKQQASVFKNLGVYHPAQSKDVRKKMGDTLETRIGIRNVFHDQSIPRAGFREIYNVDNPMHVPSIREKNKQSNKATRLDRGDEIVRQTQLTNLEEHKHICSLHNPDIQKRIIANRKRDYWDSRIMGVIAKEVAQPLFTLDEYTGGIDEEGQVTYYPWKCNTCNTTYTDYIANGKLPRCPSCHSSMETRGVLQTEFTRWFKDEFPELQVYIDDRRLIKPLEIDLYVPEKQFAVEFDEIYFHSERRHHRGKKYHINKTERCKDLGVELIHIYDAEWLQKPDIVKSIIKSKLGKYEAKLNARDGQVVDISSEQASVFMMENHIQGPAGGSIRKGLMIDGELVSVLLIGKNRFRKNSWEVVRFASKLNILVRGAYTKLWKYATENMAGTVYSYADRRWFSGASSSFAGFNLTKTNPPGFSYTKDYKTLHNRVAYQKHSLSKKLPNFDPQLTEWENLQRNGWDRIWDCGTLVWEQLLTN